MKLTNIEIKNAKPREKMYRLADGGCLYLEISPNGSKYWRMQYSVCTPTSKLYLFSRSWYF